MLHSYSQLELPYVSLLLLDYAKLKTKRLAGKIPTKTYQLNKRRSVSQQHTHTLQKLSLLTTVLCKWAGCTQYTRCVVYIANRQFQDSLPPT